MNYPYRIGGCCIIVFMALFLWSKLFLEMMYGQLNLVELSSYGCGLRFFLICYALVPTILIPGIVSVYQAFKSYNPIGMAVGSVFAVLAVVFTILCLTRWPSIYWVLSTQYHLMNSEQQAVLSALQTGLDNYLSIFLTGIFTKICLAIWYWQISLAMLRDKQIPAWIACLGIVAAVVILLAIFPVLFTLPDAMYYVLNFVGSFEFIWFILLGGSLIWLKTE